MKGEGGVRVMKMLAAEKAEDEKRFVRFEVSKAHE